MAETAKKMTVEDIVAKKTKLEARDQSRNASYDEVLKFYGGDTYPNTKKKGFIAGITSAISSIFSPKVEDVDAELTTPINLIKPAIENKVAFLALQPTVQVIEPPDQLAPMTQTTPGAVAPAAPTAIPEGEQPTVPGAPAVPADPNAAAEAVQPAAEVTPTAPGATNDDWGTDFSDRLEKVIRSLLAASNMPRRCRDVAWSVSAMDGAVIGVWPDLRHGRPRIFTRTPQNFYPESYDPDGLDLKLALWVDTMSGSEVLAQWPELDEAYGDRDEVEVIQCIDESGYYTVVDRKEFAHDPMDNMMGVVPIVCVGALGLPGMIFGSTDIKDAIPVAKQINYHMYLIDEMASALVRPTMAIKDPLEVPEGIEIGMGGSFTMGKDGEVTLLGPLNLPNAFWQLGAQLQQWFDMIADNPNVLRSEDGGGLSTGKGFNAKLGPIAARMQTRLEIIMMAWQQVIRYMLIMWANFPGMEGVKASGIDKKETYFIEATPEEFKVNGEIWTEVNVFLEAQSYMDRQGNAVEIMQLYQNELIDWDTAVDSLPQVTNKGRVRKRIDKDRQWKAQGMAIAQAAAQSAMTANVAPGQQELTNYQLERGFMGETGAMPKPNGEIGEAAPAAAPAEGVPAGPTSEIDTAQEVVSAMQEFFGGIPKLIGAVWFGGDPVKNPAAIITDQWKVDVWVEVAQDKGTITRAAEGTEVYGHMRLHTGQPAPEENAIQVSQGSLSPAAASPDAPPANPEVANPLSAAPLEDDGTDVDAELGL